MRTVTIIMVLGIACGAGAETSRKLRTMTTFQSDQNAPTQLGRTATNATDGGNSTFQETSDPSVEVLAAVDRFISTLNEVATPGSTNVSSPQTSSNATSFNNTDNGTFPSQTTTMAPTGVASPLASNLNPLGRLFNFNLYVFGGPVQAVSLLSSGNQGMEHLLFQSSQSTANSDGNSTVQQYAPQSEQILLGQSGSDSSASNSSTSDSSTTSQSNGTNGTSVAGNGVNVTIDGLVESLQLEVKQSRQRLSLGRNQLESARGLKKKQESELEKLDKSQKRQREELKKKQEERSKKNDEKSGNVTDAQKRVQEEEKSLEKEQEEELKKLQNEQQVEIQNAKVNFDSENVQMQNEQKAAIRRLANEQRKDNQVNLNTRSGGN